MRRTASTPAVHRQVRARLRMTQHYQQVTRNVSQTCRFFGLSRTQLYICLRRYRKEGMPHPQGTPDAPGLPEALSPGAPPPAYLRMSAAATRAKAWMRELLSSPTGRLSSCVGVSASLLCVPLLLIPSPGGAQVAIPGPGPVSPAPEVQRPPEVSLSPERPTEVPIGRLKGYEEDKQKAQEGLGRPPAAVQEDPAAGRGGPEAGSGDRK